MKNGTEPGQDGQSCAECVDDLGLHQIFALFQMKSEFLSVESERLSVPTCVILCSAAPYRGVQNLVILANTHCSTVDI